MVCSHELIPSVNQSAAVQHMAWCRRPVNMKCKSAPCATHTHTPDMQQAIAAATVAADSTATLVDFLAQCAHTCFALAILHAVAAVHDVATNLNGKVAADCAWLSCQRVGCANKLAG